MAAGLFVLGLSAGQVSGAVSVVWEKDLTEPMLSNSFPYNNAFEPIVATHPTNSQKLAVVYEYKPGNSRCSTYTPGLRVSSDANEFLRMIGKTPISDDAAMAKENKPAAAGRR